jgi:N-acetylmuramoyl-L-alanine amidase
MKKKLELLMAVCLIVSAAAMARLAASSDRMTIIALEETSVDAESEICIVIDAGHGGADPGKIGVNGALEKDINLSLAEKLRDLLVQKGYRIVMTRESDAGLYEESSVNKKVDDMQRRCQIIASANPAFTVSLHQNSYPSEDVSGAQVFYYTQSAEGETLANILQQSLISRVDPDNHRAAKANDSYYLLKKTPTPTVIVECGFLSNPAEAALLLDETYQYQLVRAIYMGILEYIELTTDPVWNG